MSNITAEALILDTTKKLNSAYAKGQYKKAFNLLQIANSIREEIGIEKVTLRNLEKRFN